MLNHHTPLDPSRFGYLSAGMFFLAGLLFGVWKYHAISSSNDAQAPAYVDIAHRTSLMYAFACALIAELSARSIWSPNINFGASIVLVAFFVMTVFGYAVHGWLRDTDNQFRRPNQLGTRTLHPAFLKVFMAILVAAEIGATVVLLAGVWIAGW